jgi:hypothetical protein
MAEQAPFGGFDFKTVVGPFEPRMEEMLPTDARFGLNLQVQYIYGGVRSADGTQYIVERKFVGPMTGGLWLMSDRSGSLKLEPGSVRSTRGETRRQFTPDARRWGDHLMHKLTEQMGVGGDEPISLEMTADKLTWSEGDLLSLEGDIIGPGFQYYAPDRAEPLFYTTHAYWVKGKALGADVEGFIGFDHGYWQHGREWKEYRIFEDLELSWEVFGNKFENDEIEWGVIVKGREGLSAAMVFEGDKVKAITDDMPMEAELDDEGFFRRASFVIGDDTWDFIPPPGGRLLEFAEARWAGYRSQAGITRRRGDERVLRNGFTWNEFFPERIRKENLVVESGG